MLTICCSGVRGDTATLSVRATDRENLCHHFNLTVRVEINVIYIPTLQHLQITPFAVPGRTAAASCSRRAPGLLRIKDSSVDGQSLIESGFVAAGSGSSASQLLCLSATVQQQHTSASRLVSNTLSGVALCLLAQPSVPYPYCARVHELRVAKQTGTRACVRYRLQMLE